MSDQDLETWVRVQQKTFTRWCNTYLVERMLKLDNMATGFSDGLLLVNLLEIISSKTIPHNKKPRIRPQYLENTGFALNFLKSEGIRVVNIGPEDITDGKLKLILGLIWTIILRYQIQLDQSRSAKQDLLDWVRSKIPEYNIKNFTSDWQSGKPIAALAEAVLPGQMRLPSDFTNSPIRDAQMGISKAKDNMGIPDLVDAEDMVYQPDELSMMTYISYFRDYLDSEARRKDQELAEKTPVAPKCVAYGPGLEPGNEAGISTYFTIEARNAAGRKVPCGGHHFPVKITSPSGRLVPSETKDNNDGTYRVDYTPLEPGKHIVEVHFKDQHIHQSPFQVMINPSRADPLKCLCYGPGLEHAEAHVPAEFTIEARNKLGERINNGGHPFEVKVIDPYGEFTPAKIVDRGDGTYGVTYTPIDPGNHVVEVTLARQHVANSPYNVPVDENQSLASPHLSYAEGPGLEPGNKNTDECEFTIFAVLPSGKPKKTGGDFFDVQIENPNSELVPVKINDNGDGTYGVKYKPNIPGPYHVSVIERNPAKPLFYDHLKNSPIDVQIDPGTDASMCTAFGPGLEPGNLDTHPAEFTIQARDIFGNPRTEGGDPFQVEVIGPNGAVPVNVTDNNDGTYNVDYKPDDAGPYNIGVTLGDKHIKGSVFHVDIKPGASPDTTTIEDYKFTIRTRDKRGNNMKEGGEKVEVHIKGPDGASVPVEVRDLKNGTYLVGYQLGPKSGEYNITVTINGENILGTPFIQTVG